MPVDGTVHVYSHGLTYTRLPDHDTVTERFYRHTSKVISFETNEYVVTITERPSLLLSDDIKDECVYFCAKEKKMIPKLLV